MAARASTHVYVTSKAGDRRAWLKPGDEVPGWATVSNPRALQQRTEDADRSVAPSGDVPEPPRSGRGSGADAWRAYAEAHGVAIEDGMSRDDIIAVCQAADVIAAEE